MFGVMRNTIEYNLSWKADFGDLQVANPKKVRNGRAPSWSWVSCDFPIYFITSPLQTGFRITCLQIDDTPACGKIVLEAKVLSLEAHPMNSKQEKLLQEYHDVPEDLKAEACTLMLLREYERNFGCSLSFLILKRLSNGYYQRVGLFDCWSQERHPLDDWMKPRTLRKLFRSIDFSRVTIV